MGVGDIFQQWTTESRTDRAGYFGLEIVIVIVIGIATKIWSLAPVYKKHCAAIMMPCSSVKTAQHAYPFTFDPPSTSNGQAKGSDMHHSRPHTVRGARASPQASKLRAMMQQASRDGSKVVAMTCTYDGLTSKLAEQAGFPVVFLSGFVVAASLGLPDTGYIAFGEMAQRVSEVARQVDVPIIVDGDTGYGGPMNVKRSVQG